MLRGKRVGNVIRLTTFVKVRRGSWFIHSSATSLDTILLLCQHATDQEKVFVKFFDRKETAIAFIDFLVTQDSYEIGFGDHIG